MEEAEEIYINPDELAEKCGCCFADLATVPRAITITEEFENCFLEVIQTELIAKSYSPSVCETCYENIIQYQNFKFQMADNQNRLSGALGIAQDEPTAVKVEAEEYIQEEHLENVEMIEEEFLDIDDIIEEEPVTYQSVVKAEQQQPYNITIKRRKEGNGSLTKSEEYFTCQLCDSKQIFTSRYRYRIHLKEDHPERNQNRFWITTTNDTRPKDTVCSKELCQICQKWITTSSLENHMKRMHSDNYEYFCDLCPQKFKVKRDIQYHVKKHMTLEYRERFQCEFCDNSYLTMWALRHHFTMQHALINKDFVCDCGAAFKTKLRLNYHKKVVHDKGEYPCLTCNKVYSSLPNLRLHNAQFHRSKDPCGVCGKLVAPGVYMKRHMKSHEPAQFECPIEGCTKVFFGKTALMDHQASFHGLGEKIACHLCGNFFATKKVLDKHISRTHTVTERQPCEVPGCTHTSARKDYFISHVKTHKDITQEEKDEYIARIKKMKTLPW